MNFQKITNSQFPVFNTVIMSHKQLVHGVYLNNNNNNKKKQATFILWIVREYLYFLQLYL